MPSVVDDLWNKVRLRTAIRRYAVTALDALGHAPLRSETGHPMRTLVVGRDPIRLLVFGGGVAVGYGVATRDESLDGALARAVAARTGRGVVVENRAQQHIAVTASAASLGGAGAHTFHAAVWSPSFADGTARLSMRSWRRELRAMIEAIRAETPVPLVLARLPVPMGGHPSAVIGRPWLLAINRVITATAAQHDRVVAVSTQPFVPKEIGTPVTDAAYFEAVAEYVADGLSDLIGLPRGAARDAGAVGGDPVSARA